ncbi:MAG: transposase, partial [Methylobacter sp.]|nr:transposase [Candidatus Methylobacter titanis]
VAKAHEHVANARKDYLHKLSRRLVNENQVIAVEDLHVKGMMRNHCLAKAIGDAGWGGIHHDAQIQDRTSRQGLYRSESLLSEF